MFWQLEVPGDESGNLDATVQVEASNWLMALKQGMARLGHRGRMFASMHCRVIEEGKYEITDGVTGEVVGLQVIRRTDEARVVGTGDEAVLLEAKELDGGEDGVCYRERSFVVDSRMSRAARSHLASSVISDVKERPFRGQRYIVVKLYDHSFFGRPRRPPVLCAWWKEWETGDVTYAHGDDLMLESAQNVDISTQGNANTSPAPETGTDSHEIAAHVKPQSGTDDKMGKRKKRNRHHKRVKTAHVSENKGGGGQQGRQTSGMGVVDAFERMQGMYGVRDHDAVAAFVLDVAVDFVPFDAGCVMLLTPGQDELYVAASKGSGAFDSSRERFSLRSGVLGFVARHGTVLRVSSPSTDDRFELEAPFRNMDRIAELLCVPLAHEGHIVGMLVLFKCREGGFSMEQTEVAAYICGAAGEYLDQALPSREKGFV